MVKKDFIIKFNFITNIFILFVFIFGGLAWADTNGVWHRAEDIIAGTFGSDEGAGNYTFANSLTINDSLCIDNICKDSWQDVVESNQACTDGQAVVGFENNGTIICDWPNARYR